VIKSYSYSFDGLQIKSDKTVEKLQEKILTIFKESGDKKSAKKNHLTIGYIKSNTFIC
jgi:2'-5' RNA ligase